MFCFFFCVKEKETKNCVCQQQQLKEVVGKIVLKMVDKRKIKYKKRKVAGNIPTRDCFNHSKYLTKIRSKKGRNERFESDKVF